MKKVFTVIAMIGLLSIKVIATTSNLEKGKTDTQPLLFTQNKGQVADMNGKVQSSVLFTTHSKGVNLFLTKNGISYQFQKTDYPDGYDRSDMKKKIEPELEKQIKTTTYRMDMELVGAAINPMIETESKNEYFENYYLPQCPNGILNVPTFSKIVYKDVYPNIDWVIYSEKQEMKYDFIVHPGGDPAMIKVKYNGANEIKITNDGSLLVTTPLGEVIDQTPMSFQNKVTVNSNFELKNKIVTYSIGEYNKTLDLVIDPGITWATYYGGNNYDWGYDIATDANGNVYLGGTTQSTTNIASGGFQNTYGGGTSDILLVKMNNSGNRLWATYYGGTGFDAAQSIAIDNASGNIYIGGITQSSTNFANGGFQNTLGATNSIDAFLVKFNGSGSRLWATYYGGSGDDYGYGVATDASGNVYLGGYSKSSTGIASGGFQTTYIGGNQDAFLVKFNGSGSRLWATYYGGSGDDYGYGVATDASGNVYLGGTTSSTYNISASGFQSIYSDSIDAFLVKFNSTGSRLWGTYYGGTSWETGRDVTTDVNGNVYLTGYTSSTVIMSTFGYQTIYGGGSRDAFLVKFNNNGSRLWDTYYGGSRIDEGSAVTTDANGNVYLIGTTESTNNIASSGFQNTNGGLEDAYLAKFNSGGSRIWATYYGGSDYDNAEGVAADISGNVFLGGHTTSTNNYTTNGYQNVYGGGTNDAFLVKMGCVIANLGINPTTPIICTSQSTVTLTASGGVNYSWNTGATTSSITVNPSLAQTYTVTVTDGNSCKETISRTVFSKPTAIISPSTNIICSNLSAEILSASGGNTYLWSNGSTSYWTSAATSIQGTTYTVTVTDNNGCTATASRIVTSNPIVSISPTSISICSGQNAILTATGGSTYVWNTGSITDTINAGNLQQTTTYTVTATGSNACTATASRKVVVQPIQNATITADGNIVNSDTITIGDVVQLQLNATLNAIPNIQWTPPTNISNTTIVNPLVYPSTTTIYTVSYINSYGCPQTKSVLIYVKNLPTAGSVSITSPSSTISLFDTLYLKVQLSSVTDLYGLFMKLKGNAEVGTYLNYAGYTAGTLLGTGGSIISTPPTVASGIYDFGITKIGAVAGYTGTGLFYTFKFVTKNITIPNGTNFCFYLDNISANISSGAIAGLINQGPYCYTFSDKVNVWPGDLNNSKSVTTADLLPIGYFYNSTGPIRQNASLQWIAQPATLWGYGQTYPNGSAYKVFADANGDGIISNADQTAIGFNISKVHLMIGNPSGANQSRSVADGNMLVTSNVTAIDKTKLPEAITLKLSLKNNNGGLDSLYGIAFNLLLDSSVFDLNTATFDYTGSIFGNTGTDFLSIEYATDTAISIGLTRYANAAIKGNGDLCRINLKTKSTISNSILNAKIATNIEAANSQFGSPLIIQDSALTIPFGTNTGIQETSFDNLELYPNPTSQLLNIRSSSSIDEIKIYDIVGQLVMEIKRLQNNKLDISELKAGMYIAEVKMGNATSKKSWVKE